MKNVISQTSAAMMAMMNSHLITKPRPMKSATTSARRIKRSMLHLFPRPEVVNPASAADEVRLALFDEGAETLLRVLAAKEPAELAGLAHEVVDVVTLERVVQRAFRRSERQRALGSQQSRRFERPFQQVPRVIDRVHEAQAYRLRGIDQPAG